MKADITRTTFRRINHYSGVLLQQGRVQVDADWNEQADIVRHREETSAGDVIGPCGGPLHDAGFELSCEGGDILSGCLGSALRIGPGRYYVDGVLCENEGMVGLATQPDLPGTPLPPTAGTYLAYLDVWERLLTALEEPRIREVALGGPDTATRTKTVWQVRLMVVDDGDTCLDFEPQDGVPWVPPGSESLGTLSARGAPQEVPADECLVPAGAGYRRIENQLYRVEIHEGGALGTGATYKWSRDNGSVVARLADIDDDVVTIDASKDTQLRFADAKFIELSDDGRILRGEPGLLVELSSVEGAKLTVAAWPGGTGPTLEQFGPIATVRRWESAEEDTHAAFAELEDGVEVQFQAGPFRTGYYWMIPARTLEGSVEWPDDAGGNPMAAPPHGIAHHYCPVALLERSSGTDDTATWTLKSDCRRLFPPVTELTTLLYVSGDGQEAMPDTGDLTQVLALGEPIQVGVVNGSHPVPNAPVHFELISGSGELAGVDASGNVLTDSEGIASCRWSIDSSSQSQQVEATLVDAEGSTIGVPVRFTANLSVATEVAYDPKDCVNLQGDRTVQAAIERLADVAAIRLVSGEGQAGLPGETLQDLVVGVSSLCGPVAGATVRFERTLGNGSLQGGSDPDVEIASTADGLATCRWALDTTTPTQQVTATLIEAGGRTIMAPPQVTFTATLSLAQRVAYDPSNCDNLSGVETVQEAIDRLCTSTGEPSEKGMRIRQVALRSGDELQNDTFVPAELVAEGITVVFDADLDPEAFVGPARGREVCFVTVDLPYPLDEAERSLWAFDFNLLGFRPLVLDGAVEVQGNELLWQPSDEVRFWLPQLPPRLRDMGFEQPPLAHLTLKGDFVWRASPSGAPTYLDGEAFGFPEGGESHIRFPTGDGRRGGDFEMWFWLRG